MLARQVPGALNSMAQQHGSVAASAIMVTILSLGLVLVYVAWP